MRRTIVLVVCALTLSGCGGSDLIAKDRLADQQDAADAAARRVVSALATGLGAEPPGDSLGRGLYAGCDGGDPDQAAYFVDTFVTYDVRPPKQAADEVVAALGAAGLMPKALAMTGSVSIVDGDVTIDLSSQDKGGGSAGQNIFVSTGCLAIGQQQIADFNAGNGRDVSR